MLQLYAAADERRKEEQEFVLSCSKGLSMILLKTPWEMQNAKATLERQVTSRMQVLEKVRLSRCVDGYDVG